jgi:uncharacterized SAM-binding protein YcdF (DUF218 family)
VKAVIFLIVLITSTWLLGFAVFVATVVTMTPVHPTEKTGAIIVLTGGKTRIETGLSLFADGLAPELFITGVHENVTKEELMNRHVGKPLPECCITIGYKATTTTGNAAEAAEWIKSKNIKSIRLVTSNYHMERAMLEFRHILPGIEIIPHPVAQPDITVHDQYFWKVTFEEYHKTIFRFFNMIAGGTNE